MGLDDNGMLLETAERGAKRHAAGAATPEQGADIEIDGN